MAAHKRIDDGFVATHKRIDALRGDFKECQGRQATLFGRVAEVEKQQAVDHALDNQDGRQEEDRASKKWDLWKIVIRSSMACSVPLLAGILGFLIWLTQNIKVP